MFKMLLSADRPLHVWGLQHRVPGRGISRELVISVSKLKKLYFGRLWSYVLFFIITKTRKGDVSDVLAKTQTLAGALAAWETCLSRNVAVTHIPQTLRLLILTGRIYWSCQQQEGVTIVNHSGECIFKVFQRVMAYHFEYINKSSESWNHFISLT